MSQKQNNSTKKDGIYVKGARQHNLKSIDVFIPRNQISIVTGLSGSGKSSLVFDTIYAEGQRRYVETLSSQARFFISHLQKPEVDSITGLSPAVAIDQRSINTNPRSTVGAITETSNYLRLLFARLGTPHCVQHQKPLVQSSVPQIAEEIGTWPKKLTFFVLAPVAEGKKGGFLKEFSNWVSAGFSRARVDGKWMDMAQITRALSKNKEHHIDVLIDRLTPDLSLKDRLLESLNRATKLAGGRVKIELMSKGKGLGFSKKTYSLNATCPVCLVGFPKMESKLFSWNNPKGACESCHGLGYIPEKWREWALDNDKDLLEPSAFFEANGYLGTGGDSQENLEEEGASENPEENGGESPQKICPSCKGLKLKPYPLSVRIQGKNIAQLSALSANKLFDFCKGLKFYGKHKLVGTKILEPILQDLNFLKKIGLGYLSLNRPIPTLSGGEAQRVRLMSQISSPMIGALYVLDEPSIGLHPQDHDRLLDLLLDIRDKGNTILMVEHDEKTIRQAQYIIDLGPSAGVRGGQVMAKGTLKDIMRSSRSLTGQYLTGKKKITVPSKRLRDHKQSLVIRSATGRNLKKVDVQIPLGCLVGVTGAGGSGKSTLIMDTLYRAFLKQKGLSTPEPLPFKSIQGFEFLDKVIAVNQKPIGRTSRSVPATYVGIMSPIRALMAKTTLARLRGFRAGDFSFNIKGGRCENCLGTGHTKQELFFLPKAVLPCDVCQGRRYSTAILNVSYKGKNIHDILSMNISTAVKFFEHHLLIYQELALLEEVGLGYLTLGQSAVTLSGGEAQRIKLTRELVRSNKKPSLYILDEPTTGLHFQDINNLLCVLKKLRDRGHTVMVIEHQMDVIKSCDYVIDLGPGGGEAGGYVVAKGTPEQVAKSKKSVTAPFLREVL